MNLDQLSAGPALPDDFNVVIEIPSRSNPVKYEVDKKSGMVTVDRFLTTCMHYPCDYGFIPHTLSEDGDPTDVLVITPYSLYPGVSIRCRPLGLLRMTDESGKDAKILAVPINKLTPLYANVHTLQDLGEELLKSIEHFFQHYKDLEKEKWVKVDGWESIDSARAEIMKSVERYKAEFGLS